MELASIAASGTPQIIENGQTGIAYGSSSGSLDAILDFYCMMKKNVVQGISTTTMEKVLSITLEDANLTADKIGYINAHGTSTDHVDIAESQATYNIFGSKVPISSQKSYIGHTLGDCGAIEAMISISMMNNNWYAPTINLDNVDSKCAALDYITGDGREMKNENVMSNNFAFGGINTPLIFKKWAN
ncbi:MAG: 3-oxoacyl-[acyl-carrier-protein] synthase II [Rickettsiales bacterium]|jgi:3-oxoacyl-[acyl-carrier-protein] synthase II